MSLLYVTCLLAAAAGEGPGDQVLLRRIEALEARNAQLEAEVGELMAERAARSAAANPMPVPQTTAPAAPAISEQPPASQPWSYGYVGIHGGIRVARGRADFVSNFYQYSSSHETGAYAGAQVGRRWQIGHVVLGSELSASFGLNDHLRNLYDVRPPFTSRDKIETWERPYSVSLQGELGLALGNTLVYGLAGIDASHIRSVSTQDSVVVNRDVRASPFWGAGVARRLGDRIVVELEGRYGYSELGLYEEDASAALRLNYILP